MFVLADYLKSRQQIIAEALEKRLPPETARPAVLHQAMRYSVLAGGKRLRPILCLAAAEAVGSSYEPALAPAVAVELLHTYTLIHDDLPAMDDDDLRRGQPTCHKQFGEAQAILAGDALLTLSFEVLAEGSFPRPYSVAQAVVELAQATGSRGTIAGQLEDMAAEGEAGNQSRLQYIHQHKTASLITVSLRLGALGGGATAAELQALTRYGQQIGVAFQIIDDILNVTMKPEQLGKSAGTDEARRKLTAVRVYGLDGARQRVQLLITKAQAELKDLRGDVEPLIKLAQFIGDRSL